MKILPTIGPATEKAKDLKFLFNYCSMVRLNTSHNNNQQTKECPIVRKVTKEVVSYNDIGNNLKVAKWG